MYFLITWVPVLICLQIKWASCDHVTKDLYMFGKQSYQAVDFVVACDTETFDCPYHSGVLENTHYAFVNIINISKQFQADNEFLRIPKKDRQNTLYVMLPKDQNSFWSLLAKISVLHGANRNNSFEWQPIFLLQWNSTLANQDSCENILNSMNKLESLLEIKIDMNVYIIFQVDDGNSSSYFIWEIYFLKGTFRFNKLPFQTVGIDYMTILNKITRRRNFNGAQIKAIAQADAYIPMLTQLEVVNNTTVISGVGPEVAKSMALSLNFSLKAIKGLGWPAVDLDKNEILGMGKQIIEGEGDFTTPHSEFTQYRLRHVTFLQPTYYSSILAFFKQPSASSIRDIYIQAFKSKLWLTMMATWLLIITCLILFPFIKLRMTGTVAEADDKVSQDAFLWAVGAASQQGWYTTPSSTSTQLVFISGLIMGVVCYTAYSASIVSKLSIEVVPIKTFADLEHNKYRFYGDRQLQGIKPINLLSESPRPRLTLHEYISNAQAVDKILFSHSAFISMVTSFYQTAARDKYSDRDLCYNITFVPVERGFISRAGCFLRKDSPFKDIFNHVLIMMKERGLVFRSIKTYTTLSSPKCMPMKKQRAPLGPNDVFTAFVILAVGYCISICIFLFEVIHFHSRHRSKLYITSQPTSSPHKVDASK